MVLFLKSEYFDSWTFLLYLQRIYTFVGITKTVVTKVKAYEPQPADTTVEDNDDLKVSDWLGFASWEHPKEKNEMMNGNFVNVSY